MTYPPLPGPDGVYPPPPDPPIQAYQPPPMPQPQPYAYQPPPLQQFPGHPYGSPYAQPPQLRPQLRPTEGLAVASLVVSCVGVFGLCFWGVGGLLGLVGALLGHAAGRRIRQTGANGSGQALAGIIIGWICTALGLLGVVAVLASLVADPGPRY